MSFIISILGCNGAVPQLEKFPSAQILQVSNKYYLIDCGEGTQFQMLKYDSPKHKIDHIFISHLHGDHVFGLIGLLTSYQLAGRTKAINLYAPIGLEEMIKAQLRVNGKDTLSYEMIFNVLDHQNAKIVFEDSSVSVKSFPLLHRVPTCGFLFQEKPKLPNINKELILKYKLTTQQIVSIKNGIDIILGNGTELRSEVAIIKAYQPRSYAYCSDTAYLPDLVEYLKNVDLLYHEATFMEKDADLAEKTLHSTAKQAARIAISCEAKQLLIGHFSARYKSREMVLKEAQSVFSNTIAANEGLQIEISRQTLTTNK